MGAALGDGTARHELLRRQPREGVEEAQEVLAFYERIRAFRARREERGDGARFESREHEMTDRMMLDARPERREGRVDVVAHGRGKGQALAFLLAEMLKDAQAAARDVLLKEQPARLPAREAESARRDVHEQHGLLAEVFRVLQKLVTQGEELVIYLLRHVGDLDRKARADADLVEDAETVFCLAQDGRADGEDLRHAVVGEETAKAFEDAAKLADRSEGEAPAPEHLLAEARLLAHALDDLDIIERGERDDDEARMHGADMHDAVGESPLHEMRRLLSFFPSNINASNRKSAVSRTAGIFLQGVNFEDICSAVTRNGMPCSFARFLRCLHQGGSCTYVLTPYRSLANRSAPSA